MDNSEDKLQQKSRSERRAKIVFERNKRLISFCLTLVIAATTVLIGFISIVDKDKEISVKENRKLAEKPKYSTSSFFKGEYTSSFDEYYSDNFPLRNMFISINKGLESLLTKKSNKNGIVIMNKANSDMSGEGIDKDGNKVTKSSAPIEKTTLPPIEQQEVTQSGSIILTDNSAMEIYYKNEEALENYANLINRIKNKLPNTRVISMLVPTSIEVLTPDPTYNTGEYSQKAAIQFAYSKMQKNIYKVNSLTTLNIHRDKYIYFRSDHHWTALGAYYGYTAFCKTTKQTAVPLSKLQRGRKDNFLGSLYRQSQSSVLANNPDYVDYYLPRRQTTGEIYQTIDMTDEPYPLSVIATNITDDNKYLVFIQGDQPLEKIETSNKNGKSILVIKESYGNALVPFLCDNYQTVYVIDPRSINGDLATFISANHINDLLIINYMFATSNPTFIDAFDAMVGY